MSIVAVMLIKDAVELDYLPEVAIKTVLGIPSLSKFLVSEGKSTDGTYELLSSIGDERLEIFRRDWVMDKSFWSVERNFLIEEGRKYGDYVLVIDADEFLFKQDIPLIESFIASPNGELGMHFDCLHYVRTKDGDTQDCLAINKNPGWYSSHARLLSYSLHPKIETVGHNADDFVGTYKGRRMFLHSSGLLARKGVRLGHFGYVRDAKAAGQKFKRNDEIYQKSMDYLDGHVPEPVSFSYAKYTDTTQYVVPPYFPAGPEDLEDPVNQWIFSKYRKTSYVAGEE